MHDYLIANIRATDLYSTKCLIDDMFQTKERILWARSNNGVLVRAATPPVSKMETYVERELPEIIHGNLHNFTLHANITHRSLRKQDDGSYKRITTQMRPNQNDQMKLWLLNRCFASGFAILSLKLKSTEEVIYRHNKMWGINYTRFVGELVVSDVEKFNATLKNGISRLKAFGCGLLILS